MSGPSLRALLALSPGLGRSIVTDLGALLVLGLLAGLWLLVSRAWRHVLPEQAAALAGDDEAKDVRWGSCGAGCGCADGACRRESETANARGADPPAQTPFPPHAAHPEIRR